MRTLLFVSLVAVGALSSATYLPAVAAEPRAASPRSVNITTKTSPSAQVGTLTAAQIMAARPDADRYYWQYGKWWYHTPQNTWLRWDGAAWAPYLPPVSATPALAPSAAYMMSSSPAYTSIPAPAPSYRYSINRTVGGL